MLLRRTTSLLIASTIVAALLPIVLLQARAGADLRRERDKLRNPPPFPETTATAAETSPGAASLQALQAESAQLRREIVAAGADVRAVDTRWSNAGGATPAAALGTLLWAAAGGDVDEVERHIALDAKAAAAADRFLAGLPPALQTEFADTQRLVATMLAARLPPNIAGADTIAETPLDADTTLVRLRLRRLGAADREVELRFRRDAEGWRLLVPAPIVDGYRFLLTGS